jgi:hypothetical protein
MTSKIRLGELLVQENIVNQDTINDALRVQVSGNKRLGVILLRMGVLSSDQLTSTLSKQLGIPLTDVNKAFSPNVNKVLPRYLCSKYGAIPLAHKKNNILLTAMTDPSDQEAITDIEHYTGMVVEPCLAKQSDINNAIPKKIPLSLKDIFNPQNSTKATRFIATAAFTLVVILGVATYNYIHTANYGTISHLNDSTIYEHHNLMVGFDNSGKISLLGHSAFSDGYYSASFNNITTLVAFIRSSKDDFSTEQAEWLDWVVNKENAHGSLDSSIVKNGQ